MSETLRAFLAVQLSDQVKRALADLVQQLHLADVRGLRLARVEGIHLTLKFLGDVPRSQVQAIEDAISKVAVEHSAFTLTLGGAGAFPNRSSPRVLWVGVNGDLDRALSLQRQIEDALTTIGFPRDPRGFSPHLTVARLRDGTSQADRRRAAEALFSTRIPSGLPIEVRSVQLMRSTLHPHGAVYECLASFPLHNESRRTSARGLV